MSAISAPSIPQQLGVLSRYLGRLASTDPDQVWEASRKVREVLKGEMVPLPEQEEDEEVATVDVCEGRPEDSVKALSAITATFKATNMTDADTWTSLLKHLGVSTSSTEPNQWTPELLSGSISIQKNALQGGFLDTQLLAATVDTMAALPPEDVSVCDLNTMVSILSKVGVAEPDILYKLRHLWLGKLSDMDLGAIVSILDLLGHAKVPDHEIFLTASEVLQLSADVFTLPQCISLLRSCARCGEFHVRLFHCIFARIVTLLPTANISVHACGAILDSMASLRARDDRVVLATALKLNQLLETSHDSGPDTTRSPLLDLQHVSSCLRALSKLGFVQPSTLENLMATCRRCLSSNTLTLDLGIVGLLSHSINRLGLYDPVVTWHLHNAVRRSLDDPDVEKQTDARLVAALSACYNCIGPLPEEIEQDFQLTAVRIVNLMLQRHREKGTEMKSRTRVSIHTALLAIIPHDPSRVAPEAAELDPRAIVTSAVEESSSGLMKEVLQAVKGLRDGLSVQEEDPN
ncbi:hypothetical protein Pmar_PMAR017722 [Perkinsus marinus ATCC 50983]|uniref:Uncharacterized protein n=1 Tax=Perkinsus marinus (strain ATCC 50983 / TXsc) TaxID=423536 RepID=C5L3T5_PERM5|nr:hypothetical protein Pmar_PMAR017722 [Perkinsus marinus ATCC 50983]EER08664.1 hypothetical protein Pmar_PMAR017722 [Perkinsus marinus ATCC 50983]|eukprot:XP_002776848.1 hypothetical protein Pmar_PMAR017722 [Perkinsus marinus ATCC 50983]